MKAKVRTKGGQKLKAHLRAAHKAAREAPKGVEVGFLEKRIATLAAQLEYGNPATNLPERPAFRAGMEEATRLFRRELRRRVNTEGVIDETGAQALADLLEEELKAAYLRFHGPGLSERQEQRKAGTPGAGRELVGSQGPRLIEHIRARVRHEGID